MVIATFSAVGGQIWCITENHTEREHFVGEIPKSSSKGLNTPACTNEAERPNTQKGKGKEDIRLIQFKEWMDEYNIQYPDEETARSKFSIFKANVELHGYTMYKEYRAALDATSYDDLVRSLRRSKVDWVEAGVVSPVVRKQKHCDCCWAMATVASVEALHYMKTKQSIMLSVQQLIDCDTKNNGCIGGHSNVALEYIRKNGLWSESSYPYMDQSNSLGCKVNKAVVARISGFETVPTTEEALEEAVAKQPVIIYLKWPPSMNNYKGGIIDYEDLPTTLPDGRQLRWHAVLIVGYGTDSNGIKYWRFKNSWGETWGEGGYGRIRRHVHNGQGVLGICTYPAVYPVVW
ncbi:hypothetical protein VPH35_012018 [Triticum aestivum]